MNESLKEATKSIRNAASKCRDHQLKGNALIEKCKKTINEYESPPEQMLKVCAKGFPLKEG